MRETFLLHPLITLLRQMGFGESVSFRLEEPVNPQPLAAAYDAMKEALPAIEASELTTSKNYVKSFLRSIERQYPFTGAEFANRCNTVFRTLQCEAEHVLCLRVDYAGANPLSAMSETVSDRMPTAYREIIEASQCLQFRKGTACVFTP